MQLPCLKSTYTVIDKYSKKRLLNSKKFLRCIENSKNIDLHLKKNVNNCLYQGNKKLQTFLNYVNILIQMSTFTHHRLFHEYSHFSQL